MHAKIVVYLLIY